MGRSHNGIAGNSPRLERVVRSVMQEINPQVDFTDEEITLAARLYLAIWATEADGAVD